MTAAVPVRPAIPERHLFADDGCIPNSPLPLLLYRGVLAADGTDDPAAAFAHLFAHNGWRGAWRNGIYPFHHFHSTTHEVLGVARGQARLRLGGEQGASLALAAGDAVVIPAGVGHKNESASPDFLVVGAYPEGRDWDLRRGDPAERPEVLANLAQVPLPAADPVHGPDGPLPRLWAEPGGAGGVAPLRCRGRNGKLRQAAAQERGMPAVYRDREGPGWSIMALGSQAAFSS